MIFNFLCNFCNEPNITEVDDIDVLFYFHNYVDKTKLINNSIINNIEKINKELLDKMNKKNKKNRKVFFCNIVKVILIPTRQEEEYNYFINELKKLEKYKF